jgi:hypothetical protein
MLVKSYSGFAEQIKIKRADKTEGACFGLFIDDLESERIVNCYKKN